MFIRKKRNKSGSTSVQIISKSNGSYKVVKTVGCSNTEEGIILLLHQAKHELRKIQQQLNLFVSEEDTNIKSFLQTLSNTQVMVVGPELIFGSLYDKIGYTAITSASSEGSDLFRHLVMARLTFPLSKLKTVDYLNRYRGVTINIDSIYRFLDKLSNKLKSKVEQITYEHTLKILRGNISVVFYDLTTLYFEASDEDDLRKTGFSKDGKHQQPQIYLGLLVGLGGYAIGYEIFEGNIYEGHTLIPALKKFEKRFNLTKPIVVADAGLLSAANIKLLEQDNYEYILGARLKNETNEVKKKIMQRILEDGQTMVIKKTADSRLIIAYSNKRAAKDEHNRNRGLQRLEKQIKSGKLTKANINNKGYNKYLKIFGEVNIEIDYEKFSQDKSWDGLKGYLTNTKLNPNQIIENYKNLWQIEKAFRISKTDLRVRPIYHRLRNRIEAHICIAFTAYSIYKELERILLKEKAPFSVKIAAELTHTIYQLNIILPDTKKQEDILLKMDEKQILLFNIIQKNL